jgi:hypothetical protein
LSKTVKEIGLPCDVVPDQSPSYGTDDVGVGVGVAVGVGVLVPVTVHVGVAVDVGVAVAVGVLVDV